jgi:hypothetical protein
MTASIINSVSQVSLRIQAADSEATFVAIRKEVLQWLNSKAGRKLPIEAWEGRSFELFREVGYQPVAAAALGNPRLWACRLDDADKQVPKRSWTTEVGLGLGPNGTVLFGCRLLCVTMGENVPFMPSIPGFVRQIAERYEATIDGRRARTRAAIVTDDSSTDQLIKHILDRSRRHPVIAISRGTWEDPAAAPLIDPDRLAAKVIGTAHIVMLEPRASDRLSGILGREYGVFNRGVRTYNPGLELENDQPLRHPVASPVTIENWDGLGPEEFETFLVSQTLRRSTGREFDRDVPPYSQIHELALREKREQARERGASDAELLILALAEIESLKKKLVDDAGTYDGLVREAELERDQARETLEQQAAETSGLRARVAHLLSALEAKGTAEDIPIPVTFDDLEEWCRTYLPGNIVVLPRALRAAKKADFQEPALAYKALLLLRNEYVMLRTEGGPMVMKGWQDGLVQLGLEERPTFSGDRAGEEGDEYKVLWGKRKRLLDRHLKGCNSREERYCFRLYYFWDDESQQVVVGSFPAHLSTRES